MTPTSYDAVVLAGGRSRRMGGDDKTALRVGDVPLLDRVLAAADEAAHVVVVGPPRPVAGDVAWTQEDPPGSGPGAAVAAGLRHVSGAVVVLLAADLPLLTADAVRRLVDAVDGDGAVAVDDSGVEQWLCSAWRTSVLREQSWGSSLRSVLSALRFARVSFDADAAPPWLDCDTPDDLRRARELT